MSQLSEHVLLTITVDAISIAVAGFGLPMIPSCNATFPERLRLYEDLPGVTADGFSTTSPEYRGVRAILSQTPHPTQVAIGRMVGKPTQAYQINVSLVGAGDTYQVNAKGDGVTDTTIAYTPLADISGTLLPRTTNVLTSVANGFNLGDGPVRVSNSGGALPTGLAVDTNYWLIPVTADTFSFASSKANALASTAVSLSGDGTGTQTIRRAENDVICAQLVQGLNAVVGKNYTAAQVTGAGETDYVTVTANAAGGWFSLEVANIALLKIAQTHVEPSPAIAVDLANIQVYNDDWYGVVYPYASDACVKATAAFIESASSPKIYVADVSQSDAMQLAVTGGDTADALHTLAYTRTAVMYHPSPADMAGAAWFGAVFPIDPGSDDWKWQTLAGVNPVPSTTTQRANLRAKCANTYTTISGENTTWEGTTASGEFIDTVRGVDWLENDMSVAVFAMLKKSGKKKLPYDNAGIALVEAEVRASLKRAVAAGIINADFVITVPVLSSISPSDKALRRLPGVKWSAVLTGSIHFVSIEGVVSA